LSWYGHAVRLLVLWDVDYTLLAADGSGRDLYQAALHEMYGLRLSGPLTSFAGRTDSAIALEVLTMAGVPDPQEQVRPFQAVVAGRADQLAADVRSRGRVMPGAAQALAAMASARPAGEIIQSLLTGNLPELARAKLTALELTEHLDLTIGAYGDVSAIRADLVAVARRNAAARHGGEFTGRETVLVGDTPDDIGAALATGASAVGVATGSFTAGQLADAGAHVVLPDLTDTDAVVAAILGAACAADA
jgi:phosphoglycolate phosphatase